MTVKPFSRLNYNARNYNAISATMVPVYSVSASSSSINEGTTVTYTITTQYVLDGTVLYWTTSGTTVAADFSDGLTSGSVTMTNGTATVTRTLTSDITTEGAETIVFELRTVSISGTIVASTPSGTVNDTSVLTITPNVSSLNEGASVTWSINAVGFGTGTLYYTNSGTTSAGDFTDGLNSGSIAITADSGTLTKTMLNDLSTEGSETIIIQIRTGSTSGTIVGTSATVTVADTSYSSQAYSVKFNGSSKLNITNNSALDFDSGDFTVEFWMYATNFPNSAGIVGKKSNDTTNGWQIFYSQFNGTNKMSMRLTQTTDVTSTSSWILNVWEHWAVTRSGTTVRWFKNGMLDATGTSSANLTDSAALNIGWADTWSTYFTGYLSNVRIVKGTAIYTANFNPPIDQLSAISGTTLLTCKNATISDSSSNAFTITNTGTAVVRMENPFGDSSILLNGSSQYLTIPSNAIFALPGDFTIEGWYYFNAAPGTTTGGFAALDQAGSGGVGFCFFTTTVNLFASNVGDKAVFTYTWPTGIWFHLAIVRSGTTVNCYVNGIALTPVTAVSYAWLQSGIVAIGKNGGVSNQYLNGYISNFRIVKGAAVYTANFTPSTAALTAITNTTLLTFQYPELYDASTNKLALTNVGSALVSNQNPFGNYYASFNGTSQYLSTPYNSAWSIPAGGAFCMEAWVYVKSGISAPEIMAFNHDSGSSVGTWAFWLENSINPQLAVPSGTSQGGTFYYFNRSFYSGISYNTWTHVAITRDSSGAGRAFINGMLNSYYYDNPTTGSGRALTGASGSLFIGSASNQAVFSFFNGYMTNVRFVNGSVPSAYATSATTLGTQAFTVPSTPLTAVTDTKILTCQYADIVDASTNKFAITNTGTVKTYLTDTFSGVVSGVNYAQKNYSLKLNTTSTNQYLTTTHASNFAFGTGDLTIESWIYLDNSYKSLSLESVAIVLWFGDSGTNPAGIFAQMGSDRLSISRPGYATNVYLRYPGATTGTPYLQYNTWYHLAVTRQSATWKIFLNGVQGTTDSATDYSINTTSVAIGGAPTATSLAFPGYISNMRVVKGLAVYTGAFTPSTTPLKNAQSSSTNIAAITTQTSLLTCQYNTLFDASTNKLALTRVGTPDMVNMYPFPT